MPPPLPPPPPSPPAAVCNSALCRMCNPGTRFSSPSSGPRGGGGHREDGRENGDNGDDDSGVHKSSNGAVDHCYDEPQATLGLVAPSSASSPFQPFQRKNRRPPLAPPPSIRAPSSSDDEDDYVDGGTTAVHAVGATARGTNAPQRYENDLDGSESLDDESLLTALSRLGVYESDTPLGRALNHLQAMYRRGLLSHDQLRARQAEERARCGVPSAVPASTTVVDDGPQESRASTASTETPSTMRRRLAGPLLLSSAGAADDLVDGGGGHLFEGASRADSSVRELNISETHGSFLPPCSNDRRDSEVDVDDDEEEEDAFESHHHLLSAEPPSRRRSLGPNFSFSTTDQQPPPSPASWELAARMELLKRPDPELVPLFSPVVRPSSWSAPSTPFAGDHGQLAAATADAIALSDDDATTSAFPLGTSGSMGANDDAQAPDATGAEARDSEQVKRTFIDDARELLQRDLAREREYAERRKAAARLQLQEEEEEKRRAEEEARRRAEEARRRAEAEREAARLKAAAEAKAKAEAQAQADAAARAKAEADAQAAAAAAAQKEAKANATNSAAASLIPTGTSATSSDAASNAVSGATQAAPTASSSAVGDGPALVRPMPQVLGQLCLISKLCLQQVTSRLAAHDAQIKALRVRQSAPGGGQDAQWAAVEKTVKRQVNATVGKISATHRQIQFVSQKLASLMSEAARVGPEAGALCVESTALKLLEQAELVREKWEASFPLALVCAGLAQQNAQFAVALDAHLHRRCPYSTPRIPQKAQGQSADAFRVAAGYKLFADKTMEAPDAYYNRMGDLLALFAAVNVCSESLGPSGQPGAQPPFSLDRLWLWLAALCNMRLRKMSVIALYPVLKLAGFHLQQKFGRQFRKLMDYLCIQIDQNQASLQKQNPPAFTRLNLLIREFISAGGNFTQFDMKIK